MTDLAWILATADAPEIRAPEEAVRLAERAAQATKREDAAVLDTLALAYFAAGRVEQAIANARVALELASARGAAESASRIRQRLEFYEQQAR